jgi:hypothetical protein
MRKMARILVLSIAAILGAADPFDLAERAPESARPEGLGADSTVGTAGPTDSAEEIAPDGRKGH